MGVEGLTSFLRENRRTVSSTLVLDSSPTKIVPLIVDGWSFIYELYHNSGLPWVYGGECEEFARLISIVVLAWIKVGFRVFFVFDGPYSEAKFLTVINGLSKSYVQRSLLFFRTSSESRAHPRFLNGNRMKPPLLYSTCVHTLTKLCRTRDDIEIHFADQEGDPFAVELAGRVGGYVVGNDSDFAVLHSEGYLGYIALEEMVWNYKEVVEEPQALDDDAGFQPVQRAKRKATLAAKGVIPPDSDDLTLTCTTYHPKALASRLNVPVSLLPLLGSLVGNDFTKPSASLRELRAAFSIAQLTGVERISLVANTINTVLFPKSSLQAKKRPKVNDAMDLIEQTIVKLLESVQSPKASGEMESIVELVVRGTMQYGIPPHSLLPGSGGELWSSPDCPLHGPCSFPDIFSQRKIPEEIDAAKQKSRISLKNAFIGAYRKGLLQARVINYLSTGTSWTNHFLENPDMQTVDQSIQSPLRAIMFSILDDLFGLPLPLVDGEQEDVEVVPRADDDDRDELVDVVESDGEGDDSDRDFLAPLKGELDRLRLSITETQDLAHPPAPPSKSANAAEITEYFRRGTTLVQVPHVVVPLTELTSPMLPHSHKIEDALSLLVKPEIARLDVLCRLLYSPSPAIARLLAEQLTAVLALRWVVRTIQRQTVEPTGYAQARESRTSSVSRERERWTKLEARCFLAALFSDQAISLGDRSNDKTEVTTAPPPPILDRNVQLTAQILAALEGVELLAQVFLLGERVPSAAHLFSGKRFHAFLTGTNSDVSVDDQLWGIATEGLEDAFMPERPPKYRPPKRMAARPPCPPKNVRNRGMFAMLPDGDVNA